MRHPLLLGLLLSGASVAHAQADWQLEMRPSLWAAGMRGDVGFGRFSANHVEAMSFNAFRSPHADFMEMLEGRKRHTGFYLGAIYLPLKQDRLAPGGFPGDVQARPRPQACTVAATRRALHVPTMSDLSFGLLANDMKVDLAMAPSALARSGRSAFKRTGRVDRLLGVRVTQPLATRRIVTGHADIGAGGSDATWQMAAGAEYAFLAARSARSGCRLVKVDDRGNGFFDNLLSGGPRRESPFAFDGRRSVHAVIYEELSWKTH